MFSSVMLAFKSVIQGWGFSSAVERLPSMRKALGSVPSSEKKKIKSVIHSVLTVA